MIPGADPFAAYYGRNFGTTIKNPYVQADPFAQLPRPNTSSEQSQFADILGQLKNANSFYNTGSSVFGYPSTGSLLTGGGSAPLTSGAAAGEGLGAAGKGGASLGGSGFMGGAGAAGEMGAGAGLGSSVGGAGAAGGAGMGSLAALGPIGAIMAGVAAGKTYSTAHPDTALGKGLNAAIAPSATQYMKDPKGTLLPTLLGAHWLVPFTASKESMSTKPEWSGLLGK